MLSGIVEYYVILLCVCVCVYYVRSFTMRLVHICGKIRIVAEQELHVRSSEIVQSEIRVLPLFAWSVTYWNVTGVGPSGTQ